MRFRSGLLLALLFGVVPYAKADILYSVTDLGTLPGGSSSVGFGINFARQITGRAATASGFDHAFLYSNGEMSVLGTLGGNSSSGRGINNAGQITGDADTASGATHAFLYSNGQMSDLGT